MSTEVLGGLKGISGGRKVFQGCSWRSQARFRRFKGVSRGPRRSQGRFRRCQGVSNDFRGSWSISGRGDFIAVLGCHRRYQGVLGGLKGFQGIPECLWRLWGVLRSLRGFLGGLRGISGSSGRFQRDNRRSNGHFKGF